MSYALAASVAVVGMTIVADKIADEVIKTKDWWDYQTSRDSTDSAVSLAIPKGLESMGSHLSFMFGYDNGLPGWPDPWKRHDKNKTNSIRSNGKHIKEDLKGFKRQGVKDIHSFLKDNLSSEQYTSLCKDMENLIYDLQHQGYFYKEIGAETSEAILRLLTELNYFPTP